MFGLANMSVGLGTYVNWPSVPYLELGLDGRPGIS